MIIQAVPKELNADISSKNKVFVEDTLRKGGMKKDLQNQINRLRIAVWVILMYLVVSHSFIAVAINGLSEQVKNIMF